MTEKGPLRENYEDAVFALLMDAVAEQEGKAGLQLLEKLEHDPSAQVPEEVQKKAEKTIRKAFAVKNREPVKYVIFKVVRRIAIAVLIAVVLAAVTFAAFPEIWADLYNLIIRECEEYTGISYAEHFSDEYLSAGFTIEPGWLPDGFTLSDEAQVDSLIYKDYKNGDHANISITKKAMSGGPLLVDSENANKTKIIIQQYEATLIEKEAWRCLVVPIPQDGKIVYLESNGVSSDDVVKVAENLPL